MKKAWIENNKIRDIANGNPAELFHPDIAVHYDADVPDDAVNGAELVDGVWVNPIIDTVIEATIVASLPLLSPVEFKMLFTSAERIAIKAARATDEILADGFEILEDPRLTTIDLNLQSVRDLIDYMVSLNLITAIRAEEIKSGKML